MRSSAFFQVKISLDYVYSCLMDDMSDTRMTVVMDKLGLFLALICNNGGNRLTKNTVLSYFNTSHRWTSGAVAEDNLLQKARILERYCTTRESEGIVKNISVCYNMYRQSRCSLTYFDVIYFWTRF